MSIRKYIAYLRTVEMGSITQSANELGYTQSAVSKMIADLEHEWRVTLLTRNHSGITITSEGLSLLPAIQAIVRDYEELNFAVSEVHGVKSGLLRLGCFTSLSTSILPDILKTFHETCPNIRIQIFNGEYNEIAGWLRRGMIDCGFLALPAPNDLDFTFLLRDAFVAVVPETHPLAGGALYPTARLAEEGMVKLKEMQDSEIDRFLKSLPEQPIVAYEATNDFTLLAMVESGLGVSVVHDLLLRPRRYRVVRLPLDITETRDVGIAVKKGAKPSAGARLFLEHVAARGKQFRSIEDLTV